VSNSFEGPLCQIKLFIYLSNRFAVLTLGLQTCRLLQELLHGILYCRRFICLCRILLLL